MNTTPSSPPSTPPSSPPASTHAPVAHVTPQASGSISVSFFDTVRSESIKVRTVRSFWIMLGLAVAFPILITILTAIFDDNAFRGDTYTNLFAGLCFVTGLAVSAFGVTALTSEYSQQTIRVTYAATPNRLRVHFAKLLVVVVVAAAAQVAAFLACWIIAKVTYSRALSIFSGPVFATFVATIMMGVLIAFMGYAIGLNIRNTAGSIAVLLLIPLIVENLIGTMLFFVAKSAIKWLPFSALIDATLDRSGGYDGSEVVPLGRPWGQLWFFAVAAALWALGMYREMRRDA